MNKLQHTLTPAFVFLLFALRATNAEEFRDPARHYTIKIPEGWSKFSSELLAMANEHGKRSKITYDMGFQPKGQSPGEYPYILVQFQRIDTSGTSYDQIEKVLAKGIPAGVRKAEGTLADLVKNVKLGTIVLDRKKNRAVFRVEARDAEGNKVQLIS